MDKQKRNPFGAILPGRSPAPVSVSPVTTSAELSLSPLKAVPIPRRTSQEWKPFDSSPNGSPSSDPDYSPRFSSSPAGSGGKYMVRSKRASWIDSSHKPLIAPLKPTDLKSGSLSQLRQDRQDRQFTRHDGRKSSASSIITDTSEDSFLSSPYRTKLQSPRIRSTEEDSIISPESSLSSLLRRQLKRRSRMDRDVVEIDLDAPRESTFDSLDTQDDAPIYPAMILNNDHFHERPKSMSSFDDHTDYAKKLYMSRSAKIRRWCSVKTHPNPNEQQGPTILVTDPEEWTSNRLVNHIPWVDWLEEYKVIKDQEIKRRDSTVVDHVLHWWQTVKTGAEAYSIPNQVGYRFSGIYHHHHHHYYKQDLSQVHCYSIKSRLEFAKEACNAELRLIIDGLNEYVERGLQYVEKDDIPQVLEHKNSCLLPHKRSLASLEEEEGDKLDVTLISEDSYLPTPFILTLQDLIILAQHVMDTSLDEILETSGACAEAVSNLRQIGSRWDQHEAWPCREWYLRLLLCVAALNRVAEWWVAERGFWSLPATTTSSVHASDTESMVSKMETDEDDMSLDSSNKAMYDPIKNTTIILELSLTAAIQYVSPIWQDVVGSDPQSVVGHSITQVLSKQDQHVFDAATQKLLADDSHTIEVRFHVLTANGSVEMESKGMLMYNRVTSEPSHTMWVMKPDMYRWNETKERTSRSRSKSEPFAYLSEETISLEKIMALPPVLCHVCERWVVAAFFEQHSELCIEIHQNEMDINGYNDDLLEIKHSVHERIASVQSALERLQKGEVTIDEREEDDNDSLFGDYLPLDEAVDPLEMKKAELDVYKDLVEILETALSISMPGSTEEEVENESPQSPRSKDKMVQIIYWRPPSTDDYDVRMLVNDVEELTKNKVDAVNRMRDRLEYNGRAREEFQRTTQQQPNWTEFVPPKEKEPKKKLKKGLLGRIKSWRRKQRKSNPIKFLTPNAPIVDMETIETPVGSPQSSTHKYLLSNSNTPGVPGKSPSSPLHAPVASRPTFPSIKDFDIIKPISKGAFGSVFLAKKRTTGDYYAIKFLKKSDMIAKNQVTNVKAERMILMSQTDSPYVTKLYYTFQSKDYLYLVLEYLNGGDCSALIKVIGSLTEDWTRNYLAEVTLGLEYLQSKNIVHRDLKPDNLLIDHNGHLKLTDFGLSRIGFLDRRVRDELTTQPFSPGSPAPSRSGTPPQSPADTTVYRHSYFSLLFDPSSGNESSESRPQRRPLSTAFGDSTKNSTPRQAVGTPDYLAPESILGTGQDSMVDWWALGVICYEFLYGIPPFHAETPDKVFENILSCRIDWHEHIPVSPEARDFMERLMTSDPTQRLGYHGAQEVKQHPFFKSIQWDTFLTESPSFIPHPEGMEDTDYFDTRGATMLDDSSKAQVKLAQAIIQEQNPENLLNKEEDFGTFNFKNLPVLEKANEDVIRKIRNDSISPSSSKLLKEIKPQRSRSASMSLIDKVVSESCSTPSLAHKKTVEPKETIKKSDSTRSDLNKQITCLVADDNPISCKIIETILIALHCQCVIVRNGAQAIRSAMGDVRFDIIFLDIRMPIIDGETAARMITSTNNKNKDTPIIAVTAYESTVQQTKIFDDILSKPVTKHILAQRLEKFCKQ
ncbi:unnamed protein product [Rhizopus stolonifer]